MGSLLLLEVGNAVLDNDQHRLPEVTIIEAYDQDWNGFTAYYPSENGSYMRVALLLGRSKLLYPHKIRACLIEQNKVVSTALQNIHSIFYYIRPSWRARPCQEVQNRWLILTLLLPNLNSSAASILFSVGLPFRTCWPAFSTFATYLTLLFILPVHFGRLAKLAWKEGLAILTLQRCWQYSSAIMAILKVRSSNSCYRSYSKWVHMSLLLPWSPITTKNRLSADPWAATAPQVKVACRVAMLRSASKTPSSSFLTINADIIAAIELVHMINSTSNYLTWPRN